MKSIFRPFVSVGRWLRKHWKLTLLLIIIALGGFLFWRNKVAQANVPLNFVSVKKEKLTKKLNISGVVDAKQKATLRFIAGGKIVYLGAKEGDWVKKGQTIATIDSRSLQKQLTQNLNSYFIERMTFEQNQEDRRDEAPTDALSRQAQQDQKTLENSVLNVEIQDIVIRNNVLSTPLAGVLVSAPTPISGVTLTPSDAFEVIDPNSLVFKAAVEETDIAIVKKGQIAEIRLDAYPDENLSATVSAVAYKSSQSTKGTVFLVEMPIINTGKDYSILEKFRLGMNGDVDIIVDEKDSVLQIPIDALIERDDKTFVQKKTGEHTFEEVEIKTGIETDDMIEVTEGLNEGDEVVVP